MRYLVLCLFFSVPAYAENLLVGYFNLPPYAFDANGEPRGVAIEHNRRLFNSIGYRVTFKKLPFGRVLRELKSSKLDAALILGRTEEREYEYKYPQRHYFEEHNSLVVLQDSAIRVLKFPQDLDKLRIIYAKGGYLSASMRGLPLKQMVFGHNYVEQLLMMVAAKRVDAAYIPTGWSFRYSAAKLHLDDRINIIPTPDPPEKFYLAFRNDIDENLVASYDQANVRLISESVIAEYVRQEI